MVDISVESLSSTQGKKRLASPDSSSTLANEDDSRSKTLSPNPSTKSGTDAAGSSQPNKTLGSAVKKESKPGVTGTSCANCGTTKTPLWRRASDGQTICNACGLYYKARNLTRPPWLKRNMGCPSYNQQQSNRQHLVCANCRTTTTPLWRRDSSGNTICNACGLYYKLHNVHRPVTMKRAVIRRRKRVIPPSP
ncbi:hypothetical protein BCR41DRAFT_306391, partial [Lobosporangium transversale]